jgi:hypothetical protein
MDGFPVSIAISCTADTTVTVTSTRATIAATPKPRRGVADAMASPMPARTRAYRTAPRSPWRKPPVCVQNGSSASSAPTYMTSSGVKSRTSIAATMAAYFAST